MMKRVMMSLLLLGGPSASAQGAATAPTSSPTAPAARPAPLKRSQPLSPPRPPVSPPSSGSPPRDRVHLSGRWGVQARPDAAYDALGDHHSHATVEFGLDVRVWRAFTVGLSLTASGETGELYEAETVWGDQLLFLAFGYRHRFDDLRLSAYGRLGPAVHWYNMVIGEQWADGERHEVAPWNWGARAAAGLEYWIVNPRSDRRVAPLGLGLVLEIFYDQALQRDWSSGGVDPGPFDPSGPGGSLGFVSRF